MNTAELFGQGIAFPPRVENGALVLSAGQQNVRESITVILRTQLGERLRRPTFGSGLATYLFEPNTVSTRHAVQMEIERALARWEPRIRVESVVVEPDEQDAQAARATVTYQLIATQARERVSLSLQLAA
jgi:phage baseplate assembly protein W